MSSQLLNKVYMDFGVIAVEVFLLLTLISFVLALLNYRRIKALEYTTCGLGMLAIVSVIVFLNTHNPRDVILIFVFLGLSIFCWYLRRVIKNSEKDTIIF